MIFLVLIPKIHHSLYSTLIMIYDSYNRTIILNEHISRMQHLIMFLLLILMDQTLHFVLIMNASDPK